MMKQKAAIFAVLFFVVLRGSAQVDQESMESWWILGQKAKTIEKCTEGPRRYRLVDGVVYDLKPLADYYAIFTNALNSTNQTAMLAELSKWTNGRPAKGWILLTGTIEQITPKDGILMNVKLEPEKTFSDTKLVRVKNVPDLPAAVDDTPLVILAKLTGKFSYEPAVGEGKEIESWDHGAKPTGEQIKAGGTGAQRDRTLNQTNTPPANSQPPK
jgi:hypothetical protein